MFGGVRLGAVALAVCAVALPFAPTSIARGSGGGSTDSPSLLTGDTVRDRRLHFTFDDGPDPRTTPRLLDVLDGARVKATFFFSTNRFVARQARNRGAAGLAREIVRRGHTAGSHSFEHQRMGRMSVDQARAQLDHGERAFAQAIGATTRWFRPPFGSHGPAVDRLLTERGYTTVLWNIGMADWVARRPERILATFWRKIEKNERAGVRGGIVLLHDTHTWSIDAFELILGTIAERNCALVARGEEPYEIVDSLDVLFAPADRNTAAARVARERERVEPSCGHGG